MDGLKWDLLPKEMRLQIRAEMVELMVRELKEQRPGDTEESYRRSASRLVNTAIAQERAKQKGDSCPK